MRRGEVPFVAVRVGRSNDPREVLGLARDLRVSRAQALGFVVLWEELILEVGDARTGRVRGYAADHIAGKLGWEGQPKKLIAALARAGLIASQRGVWFHPYWRQSITGQYAITKADFREQDRKRKADYRKGSKEDAGTSEDVPRTSTGRPEDIHARADINRSINGTNGASGPPLPPASGGSRGASRWEWMRTHHKRPANSAACTRYLELVTDADWEVCQWVVGFQKGGAPSTSRGKKRVLGLDSHKFLATEAYLQYLPEWREKLRPQPAAPAAAALVESNVAKVAADDEARLKASIEFILTALGDPELPADEKAKLRDRWRRGHPATPPPWEAAAPS